MEKKIVIAVVKLNKSKIGIEGLKMKSQKLLAAYPRYTPEWLALSLDDAKDYIPMC